MRKRIKVSSAKAKGRRLQIWVCHQISCLLNIPYGYEDDMLIQPRIMGQQGVDVILHGEALNKFPYSVECKSTEKIALYEAIKQAQSNQIAGREWLVIHKKNKFPPIVVMDATHFFKLLSFVTKEEKDF